jgi:hypothetical protein
VTFQMRAMAALTGGATSDVTSTAQWQTSNSALAAVAPGGVLTVVGTGEVDVRATYQGVTGSLRLLVNRPPSGTTYTLSGRVREVAPGGRALTGAIATITSGPNTGSVAVSDELGMYRFPLLSSGRFNLEIQKDGYQLWQILNVDLTRNMTQDASLFPVPPRNGSGVPATARCNDGSWSWVTARADACPANGGVAYGVCPGPFCEPTAFAIR